MNITAFRSLNISIIGEIGGSRLQEKEGSLRDGIT
jgi:hypothetical protein